MTDPSTARKQARLSEQRASTLREINEQLAVYNVAPLLSLGGQNHEWEITRVIEIRVNPWFIDVIFGCTTPLGNTTTYHTQLSRSGKNTPACVITVINDQAFALVRSHRPLAGQRQKTWLNEFPRGYVVRNQVPTLIDRKLLAKVSKHPSIKEDIAVAVTGQKLTALIKHSDVFIEKLSPIIVLDDTPSSFDQSILQDSGRTFDATQFWLLELTTSRDLHELATEVRGPQHMKTIIRPWRDIVRNPGQNDVVDMITQAGIFHYLRVKGKIQF